MGSNRVYLETTDLNLEKPHLINPKIEDPLQLISFHVDRSGSQCYITAVPRAGIENDEKIRALETIDIVGLNREEPGYNLVTERGNEFSITDFENIVYNILAADNAKDLIPAKRRDYIDSINALRGKLKKFVKPNRVFSGVYRDFLRRKNIEYESLL
ncbi:MAG: hypothetical protein IIB44_08005 [Candidatus Marinimicrobia bacterium]|nr:hypothetical protein [Candidatus Neomarinimicrobiota bacterium]